MLAVVSGADKHDRCVRMWISDEGSSVGATTGVDMPQTFRRVAVPGIGEHRAGVNSVQSWPISAAVVPNAFRYYRIIVMRTERQLKEVKLEKKDGEVVEQPKMPPVGMANVRVFAKAGDDEEGLEAKPTVAKPTSVMNLSFAKPNAVDLNDPTAPAHGPRFGPSSSFDWSLPAADPEPDRPYSFLRCATGVVEIHFEEPVVPHSYSWEATERGPGSVVEPPEHWEVHASDDWVSWIKIDDTKGDSTGQNAAMSELYTNDCVSREISLQDDPAMCLSPFAPGDLRHVPMVVSSGEKAVRVWSICSDYETLSAKNRRAKGVCLSVMRGHEDDVICCAVTEDGSIVSGSQDNTVRIWRPHGGHCLEVLQAGSPVLCVTTFTMSSSIHLHDERILLRKSAQPNRSVSYTIRKIDDVKTIPGGRHFLSSGSEDYDTSPVPSFGEAGEDTFQAYSWRLEPAGTPGAMYISCDRDGAMWYLGHDNGKVVLTDRDDRSAWTLEFDAVADLRPATPKNAVGRGRGGAALLKLSTFYQVDQSITVYKEPHKAGKGDEVSPGSIIQIVDLPVRPIDAQEDLWQQIVVVESSESCWHGDQNAPDAKGNAIGGWLLVARKTDDLVDSLMSPLESATGMAYLRCCTVFDGRPPYLTIAKKDKDAETTKSAGLAEDQEEDEMGLQFAHKGQRFKFEQAAAETTVVAGCDDGTAKIWSNTSANGRWVLKKTEQDVKHAGAIQQVHLVATTNDDDTEGMLLITCSKEVEQIDEESRLRAQGDQTIGIWRIDAGLWQCICRLHPLVVPDYIAGMVKYVDPGRNNSFQLTYADPSTISLTATDLLRIRGDYQSLFEKLVKSLQLDEAVGSVADRSRSRDMEPDLSFNRERRDDDEWEECSCFYWIQRSDSMNGHGPTFVNDQPLSLEDCVVGMVIRDGNTPSDQPGGLYTIVSIDDPNAEDEMGFIEKLFNPQKALKSLADGLGDLFAEEALEATITVSRLDDITGRPDMKKFPESGKAPGEFIQAAFWEGYSPRPGPDWMLFFCTCMPYDWSVWLRERGIGIFDLAQMILTWPALVWGIVKARANPFSDDEDKGFPDSEEDGDWQTLLESAKVGQPVEAMVVPIPGAAGMYKGATAEWDNLIKFEAEEDHQSLSLLHVCVSYCDEHEEEQNSLLALEVPEVVIQFKWYMFGQKKIMEEFRYYIWLVLSFSVFTYRRIEYGYEMGEKIYDHILAAAVVGLTCKFMWGEITAVRVGGWKDYLPDFWNWLDWTCYILLMIVVTTSWKFPDLSASWEQKQVICDTWMRADAVLYAMPQLLLWAKVLYFLRAFEETGVFTMMIVRIIAKTKYFMIIMAIMILGFTFTFYIMFNESDRLRVNVDRRAYDSMIMSLISTYNMGILGDFNMEAFHEQEEESWLLFLFVLLTAIVQIVLLNLLIALMGSIYEEEQENSANHRRAERASMLLEIESKVKDPDPNSLTVQRYSSCHRVTVLQRLLFDSLLGLSCGRYISLL